MKRHTFRLNDLEQRTARSFSPVRRLLPSCYLRHGRRQGRFSHYLRQFRHSAPASTNFSPTPRDLGARHVGYGVRADCQTVGAALLDALAAVDQDGDLARAAPGGVRFRPRPVGRDGREAAGAKAARRRPAPPRRQREGLSGLEGAKAFLIIPVPEYGTPNSPHCGHSVVPSGAAPRRPFPIRVPPPACRAEQGA